MSEKKPVGGRLTEYALFVGILVGVAIMSIAAYTGGDCEKPLKEISDASEAGEGGPDRTFAKREAGHLCPAPRPVNHY